MTTYRDKFKTFYIDISAVAGQSPDVISKYILRMAAAGGHLHYRRRNTTGIRAPRRRPLYQPVLPFEVSFT